MKLKNIGLSLITAGLLIGCGSSGDSTQTGTFVDAPVAGMSYETTSGITGTTDEAGHFKYKEGDYVSFKLGNVNLGTTKGVDIVTPLNVTDNDPQKAAYVAYILQSLDTDGDNTDDVIKLPSNEELQEVLSSIDLNDEANITATIATVKTQLQAQNQYTFPNVDISEANATMVDYLKETGVMTTETGFTKEGLAGKTFYIVHTYKGDDELEPYGYVVDMTFGFDNDKMTYHLDPTYVGDEREGSVEYSIDENGVLSIDGGTYKITNTFGDVIETYHTSAEDPESNETRYFTTSKEEAEKLAILLNVKATNSYKPVIDSGKLLYADDDGGLLTKYVIKDIKFTPTQVSGYSIEEGKSFTDSLNFNSDYTSYTNDYDDSCHIDDVNVELGFIKEECNDESGIYFFFSETEAKNFVPLLIEHFHGEQIDPKTLDNKVLYKVSDYRDGDYYNVWLQAIKIDGDKINFYDTKDWVLDTNAELVDAWSENNVKVSYLSDGEIEIAGDYTWNENNQDDTYTKSYVYKFDLAGQVVGKTLPVAIIANNDESLEDTLYSKISGLQFTKGYAYCQLLFDECYFDKDAMDEIVNYYNNH